MYKIIGYYVCQLVETPQFLCNISDKMLSVSGCFGGVQPDLIKCFGQNGIDKKEYRSVLKLDDAEFNLLQDEIGCLFGKGIAVDGRFVHKEDAQHFCEDYFSQLDCIIVSVSTTEEYYELLISELGNENNSRTAVMNGGIDENELIGFDIIGWDIGGFHSFLCNNLQRELADSKFNKYLLLDNTFEEVVKFTQQIEGKGEPVDWIPCRIGRC